MSEETRDQAPAPPGAKTSATPPADDPFAAKLRGFGPVGLLAMASILFTGNIEVAPMVFVPVGALFALEWVRRSHTQWSAVGYVRPSNWLLTVVGGVLLGAALKLVTKAALMPLIGAPPVNPTYHFLAGNRAMLPVAIPAMLVAGFGEETVFRGFLFERFGKLFGPSAAAKVAIVVLTSALFALGHWSDQGLAGVELAMITGLTFGTLYAVTRNLPLAMIAHASFDLAALALIYADAEVRVAHWLFR